MNEKSRSQPMNWGMTALIGLLGVAVGAGVMFSVKGASAPDAKQIEPIVHNYILNHPEILPQAMDKLQAREAAQVIETNRAAIDRPYATAWQGSNNPDVTIVEFYDYACGYCKRSVDTVRRLLDSDPRVRVVFREFPVLSPESERAAYVSLAAAEKGDFIGFHRAMYNAGSPDAETLARVAQEFGIDASAAPTPAAQAEVARNHQLAQSLNMTGTPSWIIGNRVYSGMLDYDQLRKAVAEARAEKNAPAKEAVDAS